MSAGLVGLLGGVAVSIVGLAAVTAATDVAVAAARAQTAADAAALAAASASPLAGGDGDQQGAAGRAAAANGAVLAACCSPAGEPWTVLRVEVAAAVAPRAGMVRAVLPAVTVRAAAALRPPEDAGEHALRAGDGRLVWPAAGPVTSGFGWRTHPISGTRRFHAGIDIGAPAGAAVRAADAGVVAAAGWRGGYGLTVVVDHGDGVTTLYAHLSSIAVRVGQPVAPGQQLGAVGSTGASTGPHLHFEVRVRGSPADPAVWLASATRRGPDR